MVLISCPTFYMHVAVCELCCVVFMISAMFGFVPLAVCFLMMFLNLFMASVWFLHVLFFLTQLEYVLLIVMLCFVLLFGVLDVFKIINVLMNFV